MSNKLVSIIIPLYNAENYIKQCLESIINQTYRDIEVIIIDDASTDNSLNVINGCYCNDKRIEIVNLKENKGLANARKLGISKSKGDYIMFIDADDWLDINAIEFCVNNIERYKCDIVRFGIVREIVSEKRKVLFDLPFYETKYISKENLKKEIYPIILQTYSFNSLCAQLIKRELINADMVDYDIVMGEDLFCNIKIFDKMDSIIFIPKYMYHYRYNENSITTKTRKNNIEKKINDVIKVYSTFFYYIEKWNMKKDYTKIVSCRILSEITNQFINIFLINNIKKSDIKKLLEKIFIEDCYNTIKKNICIEDIKKSNYINKKFMIYLYTKDVNKVYLHGNFIYKNKVIIKILVKKIRKLIKRR